MDQMGDNIIDGMLQASKQQRRPDLEDPDVHPKRKEKPLQTALLLWRHPEQ